MLDVLEGLTPADLGFDPEQFPDFRQLQLEGIEQAVYGEQRVQALCMPTGCGKTLLASAVHKLTGWRTAMITPLKGHQDQMAAQFSKVGLCDIRGKTNYQCQDQANLTCRDGQKIGCRYFARDSSSSCVYDQVKRKAKNNPWVAANFSYWLNVNDKANGIERSEKEGRPNPFECLIVDEAHLAPNILADYLAVYIYEKELKEMLGVDGLQSDSIQEWKRFAAEQHREADIQLENMERILLTRGSRASKKELEHAARLESLVDKLEKIKDTNEKDWVCEYREGGRYGRSWEFEVIWPGLYAEQYLFVGIPRVILMSATLRPKTLGLLGVKKENYDFREWPRVFPAGRNPLYYYPVKGEDGKVIRLNYKSDDTDLRAMVEWIDQILDQRMDRKGIVHTVSYSRQTYLMEHSRHRNRMMGNTADPESGTASDICEAFKRMQDNAVLVSPSFGTGWDFPGSTCEFIIAPKIPFPNGKSKVMKARKDRDESYLNYIAMQELVQGAGRGMRSADDRCEFFLLDGGWNWFVGQNRSLAPRWFADSVKTVNGVPEAPEKLRR